MKNFLAAFKFLAIGGRFDETPSPREPTAATALFFPLVGLFIGFGLAIVNRILEPRLESELLAVVLTAAMILVTRSAHLDGTLKTFAGLAGTTAVGESVRPTQTHGLVAVLLVVLLKTRAIEVIGDTRTLSLLLTPIFGRWSLLIFLYGAASAADESIAGVARNVKGWHLWVTTIATVAFVVFLGGRTALWVGLSVSLLALLGRVYLRRRCGAYTYDNLGALVELSEALTLVLFASL